MQGRSRKNTHREESRVLSHARSGMCLHDFAEASLHMYAFDLSMEALRKRCFSQKQSDRPDRRKLKPFKVEFLVSSSNFILPHPEHRYALLFSRMTAEQSINPTRNFLRSIGIALGFWKVLACTYVEGSSELLRLTGEKSRN